MTEIAMGEFYVYEHWRPDKGVCFYVGKGRRNRAGQMNARSQHHKNVQAKLVTGGLKVEIRIVAAGMSEEEAFAYEAKRIAYWRAQDVPLVNKCDGGGGVSGWRHGPEQIRKMREARLGKRHSEATRRHMSQVQKGRSFSLESRKKMSLGQKNSRVPIEEKRRSAEEMRKHISPKRSPEVRARMAAATRLSHKLNPRSQEVREKIGAAQRGKRRQPHTPETKAKMSAAAKAWRAARRAKQSILQGQLF